MRIATVQMDMKWRVRENLNAILSANVYLARQGIDVVLYPELAITGYHREIRAEVQTVLQDPTLLAEIAASARENQLFVWIGTPVKSASGIYNSYHCYDPKGQLLCEIHKNGLTDVEKIVFTSGTERPIVQVDRWSISAFICRESADLSILWEQFGARTPDILLWPGFIGNRSSNPEGLTEQGINIASALSAHVIQTNWANSLNAPQQQDLGGSIVTDRAGQLIGRCPDATPGIGIVDLKRGQFHWDETFF